MKADEMKDVRERLGLTQPAMASKIDISISTINDFENGRGQNFSPRTRSKLAMGYGLPIGRIHAACDGKSKRTAVAA